jgi:hypothetical protein
MTRRVRHPTDFSKASNAAFARSLAEAGEAYVTPSVYEQMNASARPPNPTVSATPDLAIEYEYSLNPDLLLDTEKRSEWPAADDLVGFARRLLMRSSVR